MRNFIAEMIGTFALVFFCSGSGAVNGQYGGALTLVGIAITCGLVVMSMIYALGNISGAHLNPAVSIGFAIAGRFSWLQVLPYIISQVIGAVAASLMLKYLFPASEFLGATIPSGSDMQSFVMEIILTFILMLVIINVATGSKEQGMFAGLAIGGVVTLEVMLGGPVSGASMNPARSLAPALVSGHLQHVYVYLVAPVLGAVLAVPVWKYLTTKL